MDGETIAKQQMQLQILNDLSEPFDPSLRKQRQVSGPQGPRTLDYYDLMTVVDRLNQVAPGWCCTVKSQDVRPFGQTGNSQPRLMLTALVSVYIPGIGTRDHMGVQVVNAESGGEDLWKGAISDGIKKAASLFGVGRELYGEDPVSAPAPLNPAQREIRQQHQADLSQMNRPQQPRQPVAVMQADAPPTDRQIDMFTRLSYERGYAYSDVDFSIKNLNRQQISTQIDQLMAQQGVKRLERDQPIPQWWINGEDEPPF